MNVIAMSVEPPWMKHAEGDYSADISELEHHSFNSNKDLFPHPYVAIAKISLSQFTPHRDGENEITHWTYNNGNDTFEIFND